MEGARKGNTGEPASLKEPASQHLSDCTEAMLHTHYRASFTNTVLHHIIAIWVLAATAHSLPRPHPPACNAVHSDKLTRIVVSKGTFNASHTLRRAAIFWPSVNLS
jgi:hypothetical protein